MSIEQSFVVALTILQLLLKWMLVRLIQLPYTPIRSLLHDVLVNV